MILAFCLPLVSLLLRKEAYGFITSLDGREIYFHKNSLPAGEFDRLEIGTGVRWVKERGEKGRRPAPPGLLTSLASELASSDRDKLSPE